MRVIRPREPLDVLDLGELPTCVRCGQALEPLDEVLPVYRLSADLALPSDLVATWTGVVHLSCGTGSTEDRQ